MNSPGDIYRTIFEHAQTGLILADKNGIILAANKVFFSLSGYNSQELVEKTRIDSLVYKDDFLKIAKIFEDILEKKISSDRIYECRLLKKGGETVDVAITLSFDKKCDFAIITVLNITDKKKITQALKRREAILEAINFASNRFLKAASWKEVMPEALRALGEASKVARIYCFENFADAKTGLLLMNEIFEWTYDKDAAQIENPRMQRLSYEKAGVIRWKEKLSKGEIVFADINSVENEEKQNMEKLGVRTSVIAPVFLNDRWWGFIGLDETREERIWTDAEIDALGAAAGIIGSAIYKQESSDTLIAYITESALRIKEPSTVIRDNLIQIKKDVLDDIVSKESIAVKIDIQVKNIDQVNKNLKELHKAIVEKRNEIPDAYRQFILH